MDYKLLYSMAEDARVNAYAPFSNFHVGAALAVIDEKTCETKVYKGVNIENSTFGATICAERSAVSSAVSECGPDIKMVAIAVSAGDEEAVPCGICRQVLMEFAPDITVVTKKDGELQIRTLGQLLPEGFRLNK